MNEREPYLPKSLHWGTGKKALPKQSPAAGSARLRYALLIEGDITLGNRWLPFAVNKLTLLLRQNPGVSAMAMPPVPEGVIIVKTHPNSIYLCFQSGYEFFSPSILVDDYHRIFSGLAFYEQFAEENGQQRLLFANDPNDRSIPLNGWYSKANFLLQATGVRYCNVLRAESYNKFFTLVSTICFFSGSYSVRRFFGNQGHGGFWACASAAHGRNCLAIDNGAFRGNNPVFAPTAAAIIDINPANDTYGNVLEQWSIEGSWPPDDNENWPNSYAYGFWSFNRDATKACTVVWVEDYRRFDAARAEAGSLIGPGYATSYIIEITFEFDENGNYTGHSQEDWETENFCIAVDYDWTVLDNPLIYAELLANDYRRNQSGEWSPNMTEMPAMNGNPARLLEIGDHIKTTRVPRYGGEDARRPWNIYEITDIVYPEGEPHHNPPFMEATPPEHATGSEASGNFMLLAITNENSAMDVWLRMRYRDGTVVKTIELAHNRNYQNTAASTDWFEGSGTSFVTDLTGLDLRMRGATAYSNQNGSTWATLYDREWHNGTALPSVTATAPEGNFYHPNKLYQRIKIPQIPQTIAAVPYLARDNGEIKQACVYAPYITDIGKETEIADPDKAIDFRIDTLNDNHNTVVWTDIPDANIKKQYHHKLSVAKINTHYLGREFNNGVWGVNKSRD